MSSLELAAARCRLGRETGESLRERPTELSIDGQFGEAAVPTLDDQVREFASEWLAARGLVDIP